MNNERFSNMNMDTKEIEVIHNGPVTIISINRPHVRNAIDKSTAQALRACMVGLLKRMKTLW